MGYVVRMHVIFMPSGEGETPGEWNVGNYAVRCRL